MAPFCCSGEKLLQHNNESIINMELSSAPVISRNSRFLFLFQISNIFHVQTLLLVINTEPNICNKEAGVQRCFQADSAICRKHLKRGHDLQCQGWTLFCNVNKISKYVITFAKPHVAANFGNMQLKTASTCSTSEKKLELWMKQRLDQC